MHFLKNIGFINSLPFNDNVNILTDKEAKKIKSNNCFDFFRFLFAFSLILAHFCTLVGVSQFWFIIGSMRVKAFFIITGFLVTFSFYRNNCNVLPFYRRRVVRIIPAYVCCIILCFLLGFTISSLSITDFFSSCQTYKYLFFNLFMLNWLEPELPQTFQSNILPQINGSLWSMKQEVIFYIIVPFFAYCTMKIKKNILAIVISIFIALIFNYLPLKAQFFLYFFAGASVFFWFNYFSKYINLILFISIATSIVSYIFKFQLITFFEPLIFAFVLIGCAYRLSFLAFFKKFNNITYGLYLYHFPIIQLLIHLGLDKYSILLCFIVTLIITIILAELSWHFVEKPLLDKYK